MGAVMRPAMQTLNHIDMLARDRVERTDFMFAIFESSLFVSVERAAQRHRDIAAELRGGVQGENSHLVPIDWLRSSPLG